MKNVLLFVSFVLAASFFRDAECGIMSLQEVRESLQPIKKTCMNKMGTDQKLIDEAAKGNFIPDQKLQCFFKCMMQSTKAMTKDDKIDIKMIIKSTKIMLQDQYVEPILKAIEHCKPVALQALEGCQLAFEVIKCYYEYNPTLASY